LQYTVRTATSIMNEQVDGKSILTGFTATELTTLSQQLETNTCLNTHVDRMLERSQLYKQIKEISSTISSLKKILEDKYTDSFRSVANMKKMVKAEYDDRLQAAGAAAASSAMPPSTIFRRPR